MTPREKKIYALAQKWAIAKGRSGWRNGYFNDTTRLAKGQRSCGRAMLKLFGDSQ